METKQEKLFYLLVVIYRTLVCASSGQQQVGLYLWSTVSDQSVSVRHRSRLMCMCFVRYLTYALSKIGLWLLFLILYCSVFTMRKHLTITFKFFCVVFFCLLLVSFIIFISHLHTLSTEVQAFHLIWS